MSDDLYRLKGPFRESVTPECASQGLMSQFWDLKSLAFQATTSVRPSGCELRRRLVLRVSVKMEKASVGSVTRRFSSFGSILQSGL